MKKQYNEVMDRIRVTDEMKARILSHLQEVEMENATRSNTIRSSTFKRYLSAAACAALLLTGVFMLPHLLTGGPAVEPPDGLNTVHEITQVSSAEELSVLVGFSVADIQCLPFQASKTTYTSYWNDLAEIVYQENGQTATFRKSVGTEDNSGDYNSYAEIRQIEAESITATLKGDSERYVLAIWSDGEYSYSLKMSNGLTEENWSDIILSIMN